MTRALLLTLFLGGAAVTAHGGDEFAVNDRKLATSHTLAILTDEFFGGKTLAVKVCFSPKEILERAGEDPTSDGERAYLVLFIDQENKLWQVNLTVVFTGMTYGYTVASGPADLAKSFSDYSFDGKQLHLRSKGSYTDDDDPGKSRTISWSVDINAPVQRRLKPATK